MKRSIFSFGLLLLSVVALAQPGVFPRTIEVSAKASRAVQPQSADVNITIYNSSVDGTKVVDVATSEKSLRDGFKKLGIKDEDFFVSTPGTPSKPESLNYTIRLRNFELWPKVSALFDYDLVENIYTIKSDFSDTQKASIEKELTKEALALAKKKADDLAGLIQVKIKRIYSVRVYSPYITPPAAGSGEGGAPGQISLGASNMELEVYVSYEIE
jgi:uncharacterized protein YggE